jgi:phosphatidylserine/phosphatidylglycerophosphate/cardiolipin synthase-like enzyme
MQFFNSVSRASLVALVQALESGRLAYPYSDLAVAQHVGEAQAPAVARELRSLEAMGLRRQQAAIVLRAIATEREAVQQARDRLELVWTGPEVEGSASRDTGVVVRELFAGAERTVLVSCYAIYQGPKVFKALADRMDERPELSVRMFLNVPRAHLDTASEAELTRRFAEAFRNEHWPGRRLPEVFYDPRALSVEPGPRSCLHAKCIVVDDRRAFVTSANFTEAAQERNIEAGVLIEDADFARALRSQFETLVAAGMLRRVPGVG